MRSAAFIVRFAPNCRIIPATPPLACLPGVFYCKNQSSTAIGFPTTIYEGGRTRICRLFVAIGACDDRQIEDPLAAKSGSACRGEAASL